MDDVLVLEKPYEREGFMGGVVGQVIGLITGVGVAVLVLIFVGVLGGQTYQMTEANLDTIGNYTAKNVSFTPVTSTNVSLGHHDIWQDGALKIINGTTSNTIKLTNFSISYSNGEVNLTGAGAAALTGKALRASYHWGVKEIQTDIKDSIISGFSALKQTGDYLPLIVLAIIIFLVLGLVLGMGGSANNQSGSAL
jgi:hypothetical protein